MREGAPKSGRKKASARSRVEPVGQAARLVVAGGAIPQHFAGRLEAELGDHPRRGRILLEMADGEIVEAPLSQRRRGSAPAPPRWRSPSPNRACRSSSPSRHGPSRSRDSRRSRSGRRRGRRQKPRPLRPLAGSRSSRRPSPRYRDAGWFRSCSRPHSRRQARRWRERRRAQVRGAAVFACVWPRETRYAGAGPESLPGLTGRNRPSARPCQACRQSTSWMAGTSPAMT